MHVSPVFVGRLMDRPTRPLLDGGTRERKRRHQRHADGRREQQPRAPHQERQRAAADQPGSGNRQSAFADGLQKVAAGHHRQEPPARAATSARDRSTAAAASRLSETTKK